MHEGIKPAIAGAIRIPKAKTVAAILIKVKLYRHARFVPGFDYPESTVEKKIIGGNNAEHRRSVLRYLDRVHTAIDRTDEGQIHSLGVERSVHRKTGTSRKADHAYPNGIDAPFLCPLDDQGIGSLGI